MSSTQELRYSRTQFPKLEEELLRDNLLLIGGEYILVQPGQVSYLPAVLSEARGNSLKFIGYRNAIEDIRMPIWDVSKGVRNGIHCRSIQRKLINYEEKGFSELVGKLALLSQRWEVECKVFDEDKVPLMSWQSFTGE